MKEPKVRRFNRVERLVSKFKRESERDITARETDFIFEQVFSLQMLRGRSPAIVKLGNPLQTEKYPGNDKTEGNTLIMATQPLVEGEGKNQKRTYVMYVNKFKAFVGISFTGKYNNDGPEKSLKDSVKDITERVRTPSRPADPLNSKDHFDKKNPNMWFPAPYDLGIDLGTVKIHGKEKVDIHEATRGQFLQALKQGFDMRDSSEWELHAEARIAAIRLPDEELGELITTQADTMLGMA